MRKKRDHTLMYVTREAFLNKKKKYISVCVCVCVCERERERKEREKQNMQRIYEKKVLGKSVPF